MTLRDAAVTAADTEIATVLIVLAAVAGFCLVLCALERVGL